jgi:hypothetical protein
VTPSDVRWLTANGYTFVLAVGFIASLISGVIGTGSSIILLAYPFGLD